MDPISRSANPFCHGARGAIGLSRMPMARRRCRTIEPKTRSRSRMRYPGAEPPRKSFGDLACNPFGRRTVRHADPDELSAVEPNDDEAIEEAESKRRHEEKVNRPRSLAYDCAERSTSSGPAVCPALSPCTLRQWIERPGSRASEARHGCAARPRGGSQG